MKKIEVINEYNKYNSNMTTSTNTVSTNTVSSDIIDLPSKMYLVYIREDEPELQMIYTTREQAVEAVEIGEDNGHEMVMTKTSVNGSYKSAIDKRNADDLVWKTKFDEEYKAKEQEKERKVAEVTKQLESCNLTTRDVRDYLLANGITNNI